MMHVEVLVHVDLPPEGIQIRIPAGNRMPLMQPLEIDGPESSPGISDGPSESEVTFAAGRPLSHLPPLRLALCLPSSYPSEQPPDIIELQAMWLSPPQSEALSQALISQWVNESQAGGPVVYTWVEWLKTSALHHLGISNSMVIRPKGAEGGGRGQAGTRKDGGEGAEGGGRGQAGTRKDGGEAEAAAASSAAAAPSSPPSWTAEEVAMSLMRWAASRSQELFQHQVCRCPICWDDFPGSACVRLPDCQHTFCSTCFGEHCRSLAR